MEAAIIFLRRDVDSESLQYGEEFMMSAGGNSEPFRLHTFPLVLEPKPLQSFMFVVTVARRNIVLPVVATRPSPKLRGDCIHYQVEVLDAKKMSGQSP